MNVTAQSGTLVNVTLTATDTGRGTVTAKGTVRKGGGDGPGWSVDMDGDMKDFHVLRRDDVTGAASGNVTYKGPLLAGTLGGKLQIVDSEYRLGESYQPELPLLRGMPSVAAKEAVNSPIKLDVSLSIPEVLRTEGNGLEAFWRGDIKVTGDINHPNLVGELSLARGTFSFIGTTFDLDTGTVTFTGGGTIDPELNIVATRQAEEITATVTITGRATEPQIVLSRGGVSGVLRRASGLDIVGFGGQSGNAVVLGRQFSKSLYVGIEQNVNDSTRRVVIEWRLTRQFSLQSTTTGESGADLGVLWRKNY
jgi:translocation and assembly module TamB